MKVPFNYLPFQYKNNAPYFKELRKWFPPGKRLTRIIESSLGSLFIRPWQIIAWRYDRCHVPKRGSRRWAGWRRLFANKRIWVLQLFSISGPTQLFDRTYLLCVRGFLHHIVRHRPNYSSFQVGATLHFH